MAHHNVDASQCLVTQNHSWITDCVKPNASDTDLLNMAYICNRENANQGVFICLYILLSLIAVVSNASVVLASIVERWKEIDQFTFVFAVSLSFNHFLMGFLVYPMGVYTMMRTDGWNLGEYWCIFTAYCYSYLEVLYMAHVLMIAIDMVLYQFTNLKDVVKVFLVKKVATAVWFTVLLPHILLFWKSEIFLETGHLGVKDKYIKCGDGSDGDSGEASVVIDCYITYTFTNGKEFYLYVTCFPCFPVLLAVSYYVCLLYLRRRNLHKNETEVKLSADEMHEKSRTFIQRYKASLCMVLVFVLTQGPKWTFAIILLIGGETSSQDYSMVVGMDFLSFWTCLGSIFIPFCYLMTCPTYFHAVTSTRALHWLRRHEETIHGRVIHSMRTRQRREEKFRKSKHPSAVMVEAVIENPVFHPAPLGSSPRPSTVTTHDSRPTGGSEGMDLRDSRSQCQSPDEKTLSRQESLQSGSLSTVKTDAATQSRSSNFSSPGGGDSVKTGGDGVSLEDKMRAKRTLPTPGASSKASSVANGRNLT